MGMLLTDDNGNKIQGFIPDPSKSQITANMTGNKTFKKGAGGDVDITGWMVIQVKPTSDSSYYFNSDTTKTYPLPALVDSVIFVKPASITQAVIQFGTAISSGAGVQGM
jgi:hypothetical protein